MWEVADVLSKFVEALTDPVKDGGRNFLGTLRLAVLRAATHVFWRSIEGLSVFVYGLE